MADRAARIVRRAGRAVRRRELAYPQHAADAAGVLHVRHHDVVALRREPRPECVRVRELLEACGAHAEPVGRAAQSAQCRHVRGNLLERALEPRDAQPRELAQGGPGHRVSKRQWQSTKNLHVMARCLAHRGHAREPCIEQRAALLGCAQRGREAVEGCDLQRVEPDVDRDAGALRKSGGRAVDGATVDVGVEANVGSSRRAIEPRGPASGELTAQVPPRLLQRARDGGLLNGADPERGDEGPDDCERPAGQRGRGGRCGRIEAFGRPRPRGFAPAGSSVVERQCDERPDRARGHADVVERDVADASGV